MASYTRRDLVGGAAVTTLTVNITSGSTSFTIADATGWPTAANGDFFVVLDRGLAGEEKIRCSARSSLTITVQTAGRGSDGTSAAAHSSGATAEHCLTALDLDEANYAVAKTVGLVAAQGDLLVGSAANTLVKLAKGTSGLPLIAGASTVSYATLDGTNITNLTIAAGKVADLTLTNAKFAENTIAASKLLSEAWTVWTPTVTSGTGTITTKVGTGRYQKLNRTVFWQASIVITTNGTGASWILFTLPVTANAANVSLGAGSENAVTSKQCYVFATSTTQGLVLFYDGTYPGGDGRVIYLNGNYEAAS